MNIRKYNLLLPLSAALLAGCSEKEIASEKVSPRNEIRFQCVGDMADTRVTPITPSNLKDKDFSVLAYTNDGTAFMGHVDDVYGAAGVRVRWYSNLNKWYYTHLRELRYWPAEPLNFYAINPGTTIGQADKHYEWEFRGDFQGVHYRCLDEFNEGLVGDIQTKHENHDVMYAIAKNQVYETNNGVVKFHFKHILSQVAFKARKKLENMTVVIKDIQLHNIRQGGTFTYPDVEYTRADVETSRDCWSKVDESAIYSPYIINNKNIEVGTADTDITVGGKSPAVVIPQSVTAWTVSGEDRTSIAEADAAGQSYLSVTCVLKQNGTDLTAVDEDGYATVYVPFGADWQPGNRYVYTLIFGGGYAPDGNTVFAPVMFDADVEDWKDETNDINC